MTDELAALIERARQLPPMTAEEQEDQARNFAAGNAGFENPLVTRALVDKVANEMGRRR